MCQLSPVPFHGDTIFCIDHNGQPYTPMRPIVENMGLDWSAQAAKFRANKERWTVVIIATVAQDGVKREMLSMPVRKLPAWLNSINPKKVQAELRPKIELYQAESDDALWNYWMNGRAERLAEPAAPSPISKRTDPERKQLTAIINTWVGMAPIHYAAARTQVNAHFGVTSVNELTVAQVKDAIAWVQGKIDALPPVAQKELPPATEIEKDKFEAYIEQVEAFRARTDAEIRRLLGEGLDLVDVYKFGPKGMRGFTSIIQNWLYSVAVLPSPLIAPWQGMDRAIEYSPLYLIREMEKILPDLRCR